MKAPREGPGGGPLGLGLKSTNAVSVCTNHVGVCTNHVGVYTNTDVVCRLSLPFVHLKYVQRQLFHGSVPSTEGSLQNVETAEVRRKGPERGRTAAGCFFLAYALAVSWKSRNFVAVFRRTVRVGGHRGRKTRRARDRTLYERLSRQDDAAADAGFS